MKTNKKHALKKLIKTKTRKKIKRGQKTKRQNHFSSQRMIATKLKRKSKILFTKIQK